jgi:hypothetical protein
MKNGFETVKSTQEFIQVNKFLENQLIVIKMAKELGMNTKDLEPKVQKC